MKFLIILLGTILSFGIISYAQSDEGVVVVVADDEIVMYSKLRNRNIAQTFSTQSGIDQNIVGNISVRLSSDNQMLAIIQADRQQLLLLNLITDQRQEIQLPPSSDIGFILFGWSPNNQYFALSDVETRTFYIVNAIDETVTPLDVLNVSDQVAWFTDSSKLIFKGPGECSDCLIQGQLYLLDVQTFKALPLLDTRRLELTEFDWISRSNPSIGIFTFYDDKLYFEISERSDFEKQQTNFYAFDIQTQEIRRINVDLLFPDKILGFSVRNMWYETQTQRIVILTDFGIVGGYQWAIIGWTVGANPQIIYEKIFRGEVMEYQIIASSALSPNGQQISIAAVDPTRQTSGSVTVIDVVTGQEMWYERFDQPVCQIEMPADTQVVYGVVAERCVNLLNGVKSVNGVISYNLLTQEQTVLIEADISVFFVSADR
jgi:hypothetical protein